MITHKTLSVDMFRELAKVNKRNLYLYFTEGFGCCGDTFIETEKFLENNSRLIRDHTLNNSQIFIFGGLLNRKMWPYLQRAYEQMVFPKWTVAVGSCAATGGPFFSEGNSQGVSSLFPVDIYIPGCPPSPQAFEEGINSLLKRIETEQPASMGYYATTSMTNEKGLPKGLTR